MRHHTIHRVIAFTLLICVTTAAKAQTHVKALIPTMKKLWENSWHETYSRIDNTIAYTFRTFEMYKDSIPQSFVDTLVCAAKADMAMASVTDFSPVKTNIREGDLYSFADSSGIGATVVTGKKPCLDFWQDYKTTKLDGNMLSIINDYLKDNYSQYRSNKDEPTYANRCVVLGGSIQYPFLSTSYVLPKDKSKDGLERITELITKHIWTADYGSVEFLPGGHIGVTSSNDEDFSQLVIYNGQNGYLQISVFVHDPTRPIKHE